MAGTGLGALREERRGLATRAQTLHFSHIFAKENTSGTLEAFYDIPPKGQGVLGEGSYGKVCKGRKKSTKAEFAVKEIILNQKKDIERFEHELEIHAQLDHANIVKLYEVFRDSTQKKVYLVMEMCTGGELFDRIVAEAEAHEGSAFGEKDAATYMRQIMRAMVYMHKQGFAHRDIKPENFLLQHKGRDAEIKVIDFGLSKKFSLDPAQKAPMKTKAGTPYYVAPQVLQGNYDEKCDIWSCGVIMYILLCGYPPFYGDRDEDILRRVKRGVFDFPPEDWKSISNKGGAKELIGLMLTMDPVKRPDAPSCLSHPWFVNIFEGTAGVLKPDFARSLQKFRHVGRLKKMALTMVAHQLHEKEVQELKSAFETMDKDNDGTLTAAEIFECMKKYNLEIPPDLADSIAKVDTDGSGQIEYSEFIAATLTKRQYYRQDVLLSAFKQFDADGDGFLTVDELKTVLGPEKAEVAAAMIAEVDENGDGKVSFDEFEVMMGNEGA